MAITMDGIFVNGQKVTFHPENILTGDASAYTEEIGTAVEEWMEENVTGGEQVTDTTLTLPGVPADAEVTGSKIEELKEVLSDVDDTLDKRTLYESVNLYNPALQTADTISPHYYVNGVPYSSTQLDSTYNCTALIPVKPSTQYAIGVIPSYTIDETIYTVPWANAQQGVFAYDANGDYIENLGNTGTFITPSNAKYIRFNYIKHSGYSLNTLNNTCVIVKGSILPAEYSAYDTYTIKDAIAQTEQKANEAKESVNSVVGSIDEVTETVNLLLGNHEIINSSNLYDSSLQTPNTISPHYYVDGVPYSSTSFDNTYNCTALFEIEPNTEYSLGLVPAVTHDGNDIVKPWYNAGRGIFFYDADGNYISGKTTTTFTTPANARYARFNYYKSNNIVSLNVLNERCMMVKGSALPDIYQSYGSKLASDLQDKINNIDVGFEYKFSGNDLLISYGYTSDYDAVVVLNEGRANNLFDFAKLGLKTKGKPINDVETSDLLTVWNSNTDMHAPFQFNAVNNADGYKADSTSPGFVGGNHTLDQLGNDFKTASTRYVRYFADGKPVAQGYGKCIKFEIRWANNVQAYNTVKQGGGGRVCLVEYHDMIFDGVRFTESIKLIPLEDIDMRLWYGLQFTSWGNAYNKVRFIDAANRGVYTHGDSGIESGNRVTSTIEAYGNAHKIEVTVDTSVDLGKRELLPSYETKGAFMSGSKGYFEIIKYSTQHVLQADTAWYLKGSYRFYPTVIEQ